MIALLVLTGQQHIVALYAGHVVAQLAAHQRAVAPVEVVLAAHGVVQHVGVDGGAALGQRRMAAGDEGLFRGAAEGTGGLVGHGHADAVVGHEVEVVAVAGAFALAGLALYDAGGPGAAVGPGTVFLQVEYHAFLFPVNQVGTRVAAEVVVLPVLLSVGGGVEVVLPVALGVEYLGVGIIAFYHGVLAVGGQGGLLVAVAPGLQAVVLLFRDAQETAVLRTIHTFYVAGRTEVAHVAVGLADAVVLGIGGVFYVADVPGAVAGQLEGGYTLALLVAFKVHIVVFHGLAPRTLQRGGRGGEETGLAALFLYHHVPALVGLHPVDVGVDGGIAPVEEQTGLGEMGEGLVGVAVVHAVVGFLSAVPHREVHEIAAAAAVGPFVVGVPLHLRCPHTVHRAPVAVHALRIGVAEKLRALPEVEGLRLPVQQVVARQQVDAVVVPGLFLAQAFLGTHVHVGAHHEVAAQVVLAAQVGVARGAFDAGHTGVAEHGVAVQ